MRKSLFILLCLITTSAFGQFFAPQQKPMLGLQVNWAHPITRNLKVALFFTEGSGRQVFDLSGNANTLTLNGSVSWVSGPHGPAIDFAGGYLLNTSATGLPNTQGTIAIWAMQDVFDADDCFVEISDGSANDNRVVVYAGTPGAGTLFGYIRGSSSGTNVWTLANWHAGLTAGTYFHLVFTWNTVTDDYKYYLNGKLLTPSDTASAGNPTGINQIDVGVFNDESSQLLAGGVSSLMIYDRILNASEIAQLYRETFCMFEPSWNWVLYGAISVPTGDIPIFMYHYMNH